MPDNKNDSFAPVSKEVELLTKGPALCRALQSAVDCGDALAIAQLVTAQFLPEVLALLDEEDLLEGKARVETKVLELELVGQTALSTAWLKDGAGKACWFAGSLRFKALMQMGDDEPVPSDEIWSFVWEEGKHGEAGAWKIADIECLDE